MKVDTRTHTLQVTSDSVPATLNIRVVELRNPRVYVHCSGEDATISSFYIDADIEQLDSSIVYGTLSTNAGYLETWAAAQALTDGQVFELTQPSHVATAKLPVSYLRFSAVLDAAGDPATLTIHIVGDRDDR